MTILDYLYSKYGKDRIDAVLSSMNSGNINFKLFNQHIRLSEVKQTDDINYYKSVIIEQLNHSISDKFLLYELTNVIAKFDFTFKKYNTCITYGTFDLFHYGHLQLLKRIKELCSNLIVAVSTDEFNALKGKQCVIPFAQRAAIVSAIEYVDKVIPEETWEQKETDVDKYRVDAFVMGDDWKGKFDFLMNKCDVLYLPRTVGISTTDIKVTLREPNA